MGSVGTFNHIKGVEYLDLKLHDTPESDILDAISRVTQFVSNTEHTDLGEFSE